MEQEIVSRQKHNMVSLLYATCLKQLVSYFVYEARLVLLNIESSKLHNSRQCHECLL